MNELIHILSIILPFSNEIANILTASNIPFFKDLYKQCIEPYLLDSYLLKTYPAIQDKVCSNHHIWSKAIIDLLALFGIVLYIGKNSIQYGYLTGVISGMIIVILSFVIPNLFLHKITDGIMHKFNFKSPYIFISIGFMVIGVLMMVSSILENLTQTYTKRVIIDTDD